MTPTPCEAPCPTHRGEVRTVHITDPLSYYGFDFNYCEAAIEEALMEGFRVEVLSNDVNNNQ